MNKFALIVALTSAMLAVSASPTHGSQFSRTRTVEGYTLATTFEAFTGGISSDDIARPAPPPMLVARFQRAIGQATALAERPAQA